jgi:hypothetical protein
VLTYQATSRAPVSVAWPYLARPGLWSRWAPHLRGAWNLGDPEVEPGRIGAARLLGLLPVPARIVAKTVGEDRCAWSWRVGPATLHHRVEAGPGAGSTVAVDVEAPAPVEAVIAVTYGPVVQALVRNLGRVAERPA